MCHRKIENVFSNENLKPNNYLDQGFCMGRGGNSETFSLENLAYLPAKHFLIFDVSLNLLNAKIMFL